MHFCDILKIASILRENVLEYLLPGTHNVQGQMFDHILSPMGAIVLIINQDTLKVGEYHSDSPQF